MNREPATPDGREYHLQDFRSEVARRMRGPAPDRLAEFAAQRQARIDAQLPGQDELDLFGGEQS